MALPPRQRDRASNEQLREMASTRALIICVAILADLTIYLLMRNEPVLRSEVVNTFAVVNIGALTLDVVVSMTLLRSRNRLYGASQALCILLEMLTTVVWLQMTGLVSSYFLFTGFLLIAAYRVALGYYWSLYALICLLTLHGGAFVLENLDMLRPASIFTTNPGAIYDSAVFRTTAVVSIWSSYVTLFFVANWLSQAFREKDAAAKAARREALQLAEEAQLGRLSGVILDDRYELQELLGRGGMSEVYQARRTADDQEVAIKVLLTHLADQPNVRARFQREADVAAVLPSSMIAQLFEHGTTDEGLHYIAMERLHGEDLAALLRRRRRLPIPEVLALADRVAAILDRAHAAGIIHRDLKPQNIFVAQTPSGEPDFRLLDFGVARLMDSLGDAALTKTAAILGTPGYLAPEQARARPSEIGPHTDVFALAAVVYRALTGAAAFPARNAEVAVYEVVHVHPRPPSQLREDLPQDMDRVLTVAFAKDPTCRYRGASLFAEALRRATDSQLTAEERSQSDSMRRQAAHEGTLPGAPDTMTLPQDQ